MLTMGKVQSLAAGLALLQSSLGLHLLGGQAWAWGGERPGWSRTGVFFDGVCRLAVFFFLTCISSFFSINDMFILCLCITSSFWQDLVLNEENAVPLLRCVAASVGLALDAWQLEFGGPRSR